MYGVNYAWVGGLTTAFKTLDVRFMWICIRCECIFNFYIMWVNLYLILFYFWIFVWCEWICIWWEHLEFCFFIPPPLDRSCPKHRSRLNIHQEDKTIRRRQVKKYLFFSPDSDRIHHELAKFDLVKYFQRIEGNFQAKKIVCLMNSIEWWIEKKTKLTTKDFFRSKAFSENLWHLTVTKNKVEIGFCNLIWI